VHGDLPKSLESYYQETGRAARDGEPADALLLYGGRDIASQRWRNGQLTSAEEQAKAEARLRDMVRFAESGVCRRILLLGHFGETHPGSCGRCDVCAGEIELVDLTVAAQKVLSAAARTGERFGAHHLADILVGSLTDKVRERGHDALPTFGAGRDQDREWWLHLIRDLASAGYLMRGDEERAGLSISPLGRRVLAGKDSYAASRAAAAHERKRTASDGQRGLAGLQEAPDVPADPAGEEALLRCLKETRRKIARAREVPPYIVFSDKTLRAMARARPTGEAAFLRCPGVGEHKLAAYGRVFMEAIRTFVETGECG
jgi:ATP-dependent DNA helicase RecQ